MSPDLDAAEFLSLSPTQRIDKCRAMAAEAERLAETANIDSRASYKELAIKWIDLADEMEQSLKDGSDASEWFHRG